MRYSKDKKISIFAGSHSLLGFSPSSFIRWRVFLFCTKMNFFIKNVIIININITFA